ncbi:homing endonuclease [Tuber indicum]|nr:homing endonuclease [Tuber indicum]
MMATNKWPNWALVNYIETFSLLNLLPFNRARTRAILRIGPHNKDVLSIIVCGMIGDWWAHEIKGQALPSVRFSIEQSVKNSAYIHSLALTLFELGYCSSIVPKLVKKSEGVNDKREYLTPLGLAHWIMQDGSTQTEGLIICMEFFSTEDVVRIINVLKTQYNLQSTVYYQGEKLMICIHKESLPLLRSIVTPYMHPSTLYTLYKI